MNLSDSVIIGCGILFVKLRAGRTAVSGYYVVYGFCGAPLTHVFPDGKTCIRTEFGRRRRKAFERWNGVSVRTRLSTLLAEHG